MGEGPLQLGSLEAHWTWGVVRDGWLVLTFAAIALCAASMPALVHYHSLPVDSEGVLGCRLTLVVMHVVSCSTGTSMASGGAVLLVAGSGTAAGGSTGGDVLIAAGSSTATTSGAMSIVTQYVPLVKTAHWELD